MGEHTKAPDFWQATKRRFVLRARRGANNLAPVIAIATFVEKVPHEMDENFVTGAEGARVGLGVGVYRDPWIALGLVGWLGSRPSS